MSDDREDRLGRMCEELDQALLAGESLDQARIAKRFDVSEDDVERARSALQAMQGALDEEPAAAVELAPPDLPDDYELLGELGRGGMGIVYRAHQKSLDRDLAVKVLRPGDLMFGEAVQRFEREAKSLARLRHRHIVSVHEVGNVDGFVYFTMDLIDGRTLSDRLRESEMTTAQTVRLMLQVTSAIAYAHGKSVMHRDLKPANILVDQDEDAFVVDFGLARDLGAGVGAGATVTGQMLGTPAYMSPEQALGDGAGIGEASDVYALGAVLYECLTRRAPFHGLPLAQLMNAVIERDPDAIRRHNPRVPADLQVICEKAMQKNPSERYATVQAFAEDLERFAIGQPIQARPRTMWSHSVRFVQRHRRSIAGAGLPTLALLACAWWFVMPAVMRGRTLAFAERLHDAGSPQGAVAAYRDVYEGVDADEQPLQERVRYLRALVNEVGRLYVHGRGSDVTAAESMLAEAKRVLGEINDPQYHERLHKQGRELVEQMGLEMLRLEPFAGERHTFLQFNRTKQLQRIVSRDQEVGSEADLIRVFWEIPWWDNWSDPWTARQRQALLLLLPVADRLPEALQHRMHWITRVAQPSMPFGFVEERFLDRVVSMVADPALPIERRKDAAGFFHKCGCMPFLLNTVRTEDDRGSRSDFLIDDEDLAWLTSAWSKLKGLEPTERYRRRMDLVAERLGMAKVAPGSSAAQPDREILRWSQEQTGYEAGSRAAMAAWWRDNRTTDPRTLLLRALGWNTPIEKLNLDALAEGLRTSQSSPHAHNLLVLSVADGVPIPHLTQHSRSDLLVRWQRALQLVPDPQRFLRIATFVMVDGQLPRLAASSEVALKPDVAIDWELPLPTELPFLDSRVGPRRAFSREQEPLRVVGHATLANKGEDLVVKVRCMLSGTWPVKISGIASYGGDKDLGDGLVGFVGGQGIRVINRHARFDCFTVAVMQPLEQQGQAWTQDDWVAAFGKTLDHIGSGDERAAVNNAKHVALATFVPMPHKLAELRRFDAAAEGSGIRDYCGYIRKASLLLAGDEAGIDYDRLPENGHGKGFLDDAFWGRLATVTKSEKIRDYAFAELEKLEVEAGLLRTLTQDETLAPHLPQWFGARAASMSSPWMAFVTTNWWRLLLLAMHVGIAVVGLTRLHRGIGRRRLAGLLLLVPAGVLLPLWGVRLAGVECNPIWLGHALHVVGVWAFCWRATTGVAWQVVALLWTGTTIAYVTGNLDHPAVVWVIAGVAVLTLPIHKNHVSVERAASSDDMTNAATLVLSPPNTN